MTSEKSQKILLEELRAAQTCLKAILEALDSKASPRYFKWKFTGIGPLCLTKNDIKKRSGISSFGEVTVNKVLDLLIENKILSKSGSKKYKRIAGLNSASKSSVYILYTKLASKNAPLLLARVEKKINKLLAAKKI